MRDTPVEPIYTLEHSFGMIISSTRAGLIRVCEVEVREVGSERVLIVVNVLIIRLTELSCTKQCRRPCLASTKLANVGDDDMMVMISICIAFETGR